MNTMKMNICVSPSAPCLKPKMVHSAKMMGGRRVTQKVFAVAAPEQPPQVKGRKVSRAWRVACVYLCFK